MVEQNLVEGEQSLVVERNLVVVVVVVVVKSLVLDRS